MQLLPILLVGVVLARDSGLTLWPEDVIRPDPGWIVLFSVLPGALAVFLLAVLVRGWMGALNGNKPEAGRIVARAERAAELVRLAFFLQHLVAVLGLGLLDLVRSWMGNVVLLDELIVLAVPLLGMLASWAVQYPIERWVREASLIGRLDAGLPVYAMPGRWAYVLLQARLQLGLMILPIVLILTASEIIEFSLRAFATDRGIPWLVEALTTASAIGIFVLAPSFARLVLDVSPLPAGPLRETLMAMCRRHRIKVRELLLWHTNGTMMNAAVMGLIAPVRYVMLTDALLEAMPEDQVQAVMAHELGHVRRHHMPWLALSLMASMWLAILLLEAPLLALGSKTWPAWVEGFLALLAIVVGLMIFGWVCRRYERQADTFAVQHLSTEKPQDVAPVVTGEAVVAMYGALDTIARLNGVERKRRSWRHGSIAWRQSYLRSIIGRPVHRLPIDRMMRGIKVATVAVLAGTIALIWVVGDRPERPVSLGESASLTCWPDRETGLSFEYPDAFFGSQADTQEN